MLAMDQVGLSDSERNTFGMKDRSGAEGFGNAEEEYDGGNENDPSRKPLTKSFFLNYVKDNFCPECGIGALQNKAGEIFEKLFEDYIDKNYNFDNIRVIKNQLKVAGELDYTVPDYFGVKYAQKGKRIETTTLYEIQNFYELKATKNKLGLGSFGGQLKIQIQAAKKMKIKELVLVTTHGIELTKPLKEYAKKSGVVLTHYWTQYAMINGLISTNYTLHK